jgi:hypothetical protein
MIDLGTGLIKNLNAETRRFKEKTWETKLWLKERFWIGRG